MKYAITIIAGLLLALGLMFLAPRLAHAQTACGDHAKMVKALGDKFSETRRVIAVSNNNFVEIFAAKSGTWTVLSSSPQGVTCIVASGESWEDLPIEIEGKNS